MRVYEVDLAAGLARLLGSPRADDPTYQDAMPARLPDGRVILVSDRGGRQGLYIVTPDGADATPLVPDPDGEDSDPAPLDRDRIVFARGAVGSPRDLFLTGLDGTGLRRLTGHADDDGAPCTAPGGRSIVFVSDRDGTPRLYRLDPAVPDPEASVTALSAPANAASLLASAPACLADGSVAFGLGKGGGPTQIFLVGPMGAARGVRQITDPLVLPHGAGEPVALRDGTVLLTAGPAPPLEAVGAGSRFAVYGITLGGYNLKRVTREGAGYNDFARRLRPSR